MLLSNEHVGFKILAEIEIYSLTRVDLLCPLCRRHGILMFSCLMFVLFEKICCIKSCLFSNHRNLIGMTKPVCFLIFSSPWSFSLRFVHLIFWEPKLKLCVLSYCTSNINLRMTQDSLEHDPFSTFFLVYPNYK